MQIVAVSGCFDPLHTGHLDYFRFARQFGDRLVVLLDSDAYVRSKRPVFMPQEARADILYQLRMVDHVVCSRAMDCCELLACVRPHTYAVGPGYSAIMFPERIMCEKLGIRMAFVAGDKSISSSKYLEEYIHAIQQSAGGSERHDVPVDGRRSEIADR